jgi:hypothetical protein
MRSNRRRFLLTYPIWFVAPLLVFGMLWIPLLFRYYSSATVTSKIIDAGRSQPADSTLNELDTFHFLDEDWKDDSQLIESAQGLLQGELQIPGLPPAEFHLPLRSSEIDKEPPDLQLYIGGFAIPDILLRAYLLTGREDFFVAARNFIVGWASYEQHAWLPRGLIWNDHALSARVAVLTRFWRLYRHRPDANPEVARALFELVNRSAQLLAKPELFTFATAHGLLENLALAQVCIAFPSLPDTERYRRVASERLKDQIEYYVDDEGVVLEHSAGYHAFGVAILGAAMRDLTLLGQPIPPGWWEKYARARDVYAEFLRPDGSLPIFGDTRADPDREGPPATFPDVSGRAVPLTRDLAARKPERSGALYSVAGYAVWWQGLEHWPNQPLAQTVVAWSYFPDHAHKHADEMSVLFWALGQTWWSNVGYWPYELGGRDDAESWTGSNAPHLTGESAKSLRQTRLLWVTADPQVRFLELERRVGDATLRRQVLHYPPDLWIVLDDFTSSAPVEETWNSFPNVQIESDGMARSYWLENPPEKSKIQLYFLGPNQLTLGRYSGSLDPFAGWAVIGHQPQPAAAFLLKSPAGTSWSAVVWRTVANAGTKPAWKESPRMTFWAGDDKWRMAMPANSGLTEIRRENEHILVTLRAGSAAGDTVELTAGPDSSAARAKIRRAFEKEGATYLIGANDQRRILLNFREGISVALLTLFALQEIFFWAWGYWVRSHTLLLRLLNSCAWIAGGLGLYLRYFRPL